VPALLGQQIEHPRAVGPRLDDGVRGHRMAKAALEMACWTLGAQRADLSLAQFIGGSRDVIDVGISLGIQDSPAALAGLAGAAAADGYRRIKLKIAPGADIEYVAAVRSELGPDRMLSVDANSAYVPEDTERLAQLDAFDLVMIEQPLDSEDLVRHAALQRRLRSPLCLDESITGSARALDALELGSARIINIKPGRVGGFGESIAIHDLCRARDVPVWCGGMLESGVGRAYNVALASLPGFVLPGDLSPSARYWEQDIVHPEFTMQDGRMRVPQAPGLGVDVDEARIDALTVRRQLVEA
jgi:O-succinylbenzoate synthase